MSSVRRRPLPSEKETISSDELTTQQRQRYARQIGPGVLTPEAQLRLQRSAALVTRAGGMGGPAAQCLVMAGVGKVVIAHGGEMIAADLNRQVLGSEAVLGQSRAVHFAQRLRQMNSLVTVEAIDHEPDDEEARELANQVDVILACPPSFDERLRLNRAAVEAGIPLVDAAQWGMTGTLIVVSPGRTACLECIYPQEPPFEELFPVLGAISSATGSLAALEAIKIISDVGEPMFGKMLVLDGFHGRSSLVTLRRNPDCPCCGGGAAAKS